MVLVNKALPDNTQGSVKKQYWLGLLNRVLPKALQVPLDQGISNLVFRTHLQYEVPKDVTVWALKVEPDQSVDTTVNFGDFMPRYFIKDTHWGLVLPTSVGNVVVSFETNRVTVVTPKTLESVLRPSLVTSDLFFTTLLERQGGTLDDSTLGRAVESLCMDGITDLLFKTLIVISGLTAIWHVSTR